MSERTQIEVDSLTVGYGDVRVVHAISFTVARGEVVTLLGPSGCGKTTTLRTIAGLERPSSGTIRLDGKVVYSSDQRRDVPSEQRGISMVFQSYAIWPHMTVFENVAYGLRVRRQGRADIEAGVRRALDLVQMEQLADRPASRLSGGQQQRVALARAIAFSPAVILFDEPLSNLDAKLRAEMRLELRELQQRLGITSVYVTHDQEEALAISDKVIVMNAGRIEQMGLPQEIYDRPRSRFVADFVGSANLIEGTVRGAPAADSSVGFEVAGGTLLRVAAPFGAAAEGPGIVALRTAHIALGKVPGANTVPGRIHRRMFHGDFIQYVVEWAAGQLIVRRPPTEMFAEGETVTLAFAAERCVLLASERSQ